MASKAPSSLACFIGGLLSFWFRENRELTIRIVVVVVFFFFFMRNLHRKVFVVSQEQ